VTGIDIDAIRKLADAATDGPWWAWDRGVGYVIALGEPSDVDKYNRPARELPEGMRTDIGRREDAAFIAAARTLVPALCDEIERLREQLYAQKPVVEAAQAWAETVESDGEYATEDADRLHHAVEQYRLMDIALTTARNDPAYGPEATR